MRTGKQVYREISERVAEAQREVDSAVARLRQLRGRDEEARSEETQALARLAKVRLDELAADRVATGLDDADRQALALLEQRQRTRGELVAEVEQSSARQTELEELREAKLAERDRRGDAYQDQIDATMQRLAQEEHYVAQRNHTNHLTALVQRAVEKADQAEADRETKGKPYEEDKLFSYLWQRRYKFPEYHAWPLFRTLDGWVAGLCGYDKAHRDYGMLLEIPVRLRAHAEAIGEDAKQAAVELEKIEQEALAADGVPALLEALETAQRELDEVNRSIDAADKAHAGLLQRIASIDAGTDPNSQRAVNVINAQLLAEDVTTLRRDAARTTTEEDDRIARAVASLREERERLERDIDDASESLEGAQRSLADLRDLQRRFRQHDFDGEYSTFGSGFDLGEILSSVLRGVLSTGSAWSRMRRHQRFRRPRASTGSEVAGRILGGLFSGSGSSRGGFGGFGGGGGFSSGGGFGGGGGFSTGGGF